MVGAQQEAQHAREGEIQVVGHAGRRVTTSPAQVAATFASGVAFLQHLTAPAKCSTITTSLKQRLIQYLCIIRTCRNMAFAGEEYSSH